MADLKVCEEHSCCYNQRYSDCPACELEEKMNEQEEAHRGELKDAIALGMNKAVIVLADAGQLKFGIVVAAAFIDKAREKN
jgi:hypothetical protein